MADSERTYSPNDILDNVVAVLSEDGSLVTG